MGLDLALVPIKYHRMEWWLATPDLCTPIKTFDAALTMDRKSASRVE